MVNAPWNTDDTDVLREKWRMANERAIHCEKLKSDLELAAITLASTVENRLDEQLEVINRIRDACILAYRGLFQTGLLAKDFMWFIHVSDADPDAVMASTSNAIANVPEVPDWLRDKRSSETKVIMTLITNKRWKKILPLCREYSRTLSIIMRRFADELHHSLLHFEEPSGASGKHSFPCDGDTDEPDDPDGWEELTKQQIKLFGKDIHLQPQQRLVLLRLLFSESVWKSTGDISFVQSSWQEGTGKNQLISAVISKTEKELAHQLNIKYERKPSNSLDRPIQRRAAKGKEVEYRIDLKILEQLIRKIR